MHFYRSSFLVLLMLLQYMCLLSLGALALPSEGALGQQTRQRRDVSFSTFSKPSIHIQRRSNAQWVANQMRRDAAVELTGVLSPRGKDPSRPPPIQIPSGTAGSKNSPRTPSETPPSKFRPLKDIYKSSSFKHTTQSGSSSKTSEAVTPPSSPGHGSSPPSTPSGSGGSSKFGKFLGSPFGSPGKKSNHIRYNIRF